MKYKTVRSPGFSFSISDIFHRLPLSYKNFILEKSVLSIGATIQICSQLANNSVILAEKPSTCKLEGGTNVAGMPTMGGGGATGPASGFDGLANSVETPCKDIERPKRLIKRCAVASGRV